MQSTQLLMHCLAKDKKEEEAEAKKVTKEMGAEVNIAY